jgi:quercetin dioxygenase-like cupin family protein
VITAGPGWPVVKYQHVEQGVGYSMGVFVLPPSGFIPLHSHPDMCVISKVLYGDLR